MTNELEPSDVGLTRDAKLVPMIPGLESTFPPKQTIARWLEAARSPYLNFLRNLTPQIFLASMAWIYSNNLNFRVLSFSNWRPTIAFFVFVLMFLFAFYSNASLFFDEAFADLQKWLMDGKESGAFKATTFAQRRATLFRLVVRDRKAELVTFFILFVVLQFVFVGVVASSVAAAVNFLRLAHS